MLLTPQRLNRNKWLLKMARERNGDDVPHRLVIKLFTQDVGNMEEESKEEEYRGVGCSIGCKKRSMLLTHERGHSSWRFPGSTGPNLWLFESSKTVVLVIFSRWNSFLIQQALIV